MSYTPPAFNAVNFAMPTRQSTPAYNAVNFNFAPANPGTVTINSAGTSANAIVNIQAKETFSGTLAINLSNAAVSVAGSVGRPIRSVVINT